MRKWGLGMCALVAVLAFAAVGDAGGQSSFGKAAAISAKGANTCALTSSQTIACWGIDALGEVPLVNEPNPSYRPVLVTGATKAKQIAVGDWTGHACFVTTVGGVKCWGHDEVTDSPVPAVVPGLAHGIAEVISGADHACVLTDGGGVECWGNNTLGAVGNGTSGNVYSTPQPVVGLSSGVRALGAGFAFTCAALDSGGLKCWGNNDGGQLGDGTRAERDTPVDVAGIHSIVTQIAAGTLHTCALLESHDVECWGENHDGELGDGTTIDHLTPAPVTGLPPADSIAAGWSHSCALAQGAVYCWGSNTYGQLGDGTVSNRPAPTEVRKLRGTPTQVSAGDYHTCALLASGAIRCWGENGDGELGMGNTRFHRTPVDVRGLSRPATRVSAGGNKTCGLVKRGRVECWGPTPGFVSGLGSHNRAVATGGSFTCALTHIWSVKCGGNNDLGQLGDGTITSRENAEPVVGIDERVVQIAAGQAHACALTAGRHVLCWGSNLFGQLGDGTRSDRHTPVAVRGLPKVRLLLAGGQFTCALTMRRHLKCWGDNDSGQLGKHSRGICPVGSDDYEIDYPCSLYPIGIAGLDGGIATASAGYSHVCVSTRKHRALCWGNDVAGQLGYKASDSCDVNSKEEDPCSREPTRVTYLERPVRALSAGAFHTCALFRNRRALCWGANSAGQLGDGRDDYGPDPVSPKLSERIQQITAGYFHTCALLRSGRVKCWGANWAGQLGIGTSEFMPTPQEVIGFG